MLSAVAVSVALALGCAAPQSVESDSESEAESEADVPPIGVVATLSVAVQTVIAVRWTTEKSTTGFVRFGEGELDHTTPATALGTEHEVLLLGMPTDTEVSFEVVAVSENQVEAAAPVEQITTGPYPSDLPELTFVGDPDSGPAYQVVPVEGTSNSVIILDNQGRVVWYYLLGAERHLIRAFLTPERDAVFVCVAKWSGSPDGATLMWVSLDGTTLLREETLADARMDVVQLPDGTIAAILGAESEDYGAVGDAIVEVGTDGSVSEIWSSWDALDETQYPIDSVEDGSDFTHANALDYVAEEDAYYISLGNIGTLMKVDRSTGDTLWAMFGGENEWSFSDESEVVTRMHQFQVLDDGILIFDNGTESAADSRVVEYTLDQDTLTGEQVWDFHHDPAVYTYIKGDVHRLDSADTEIVWTTSGELQVVDDSGNVSWQVNSELGFVFLFGEVLDSLYP